jgi:Tetratricopeptide repeat
VDTSRGRELVEGFVEFSEDILNVRLAGAYRANGRQVKEAVTLPEKVVQIKEQSLAEDHLLRLAAQYNLAKYLWELGNYCIALDTIIY